MAPSRNGRRVKALTFSLPSQSVLGALTATQAAIYLATTRPHFGGLRWWFVCPRLNTQVRKLYLPLGGRHFWCRRAYRLASASQRETKYDRATRRARKLYHRLGGDPDDDEYPDKPKRMRWTTYNRLMDKLVAAEEVADERLAPLLARWL